MKGGGQRGAKKKGRRSGETHATPLFFALASLGEEHHAVAQLADREGLWGVARQFLIQTSQDEVNRRPE